LKNITSRRAEFNTLLALVIAVMVMVVIFALGYKIVVGSNKMADDEVCRLSVFAAHQAALLKKMSAERIDIVPSFECDAKQIYVEPKDVSRGGSQRINKDLVNGLIAKEMHKCWGLVGSGKLDPFRHFWLRGDKTYCLRCSVIRFTDEFKEAAATQNYELQNLHYWMAVNRVPGQRETFYEFMYGRPAAESTLTEMLGNPVTYDLDKDYVVFWRSTKSGRLGEFLVRTPLLLTGVFGAAHVIGYGAGSMMHDNMLLQGVFLTANEALAGQITIEGEGEEDVCTMLLN